MRLSPPTRRDKKHKNQLNKSIIRRNYVQTKTTPTIALTFYTVFLLPDNVVKYAQNTDQSDSRPGRLSLPDSLRLIYYSAFISQ